MTIRLDIGSGLAPLPGYFTVDPYIPTADYHDQMWNLVSFEDNSVDEIFSSHSLEHIAQAQVLPTLLEWKRVLKIGGKITIRVPDLEWCVERWLKTRSVGWDMAIIFGNQNHEGEFHKTGFTTAIMLKYLKEAKLRPLVVKKLFTHEQQTLSFEIIKEKE